MKQAPLFPEPDPASSAVAERSGPQLELFDLKQLRSRARSPPARSDLAQGIEDVKRFAAAARAPSTHRTYAREWEAFVTWSKERELVALPAAALTVAMYIADLAHRRRVGGIKVALAAISDRHQGAGVASPLEDPTVRKTWKGIRRTHGVAPTQKSPLLVTHLRAALATLPNNLLGLRDRALLLLGWAGARRRGELVALRVEDVREVPKGLEVMIRRSKTDQEGKGRLLGVRCGKHESTCPVAAVKAWIGRARISSGPLFRRVDRWGRVRAGAVSDHYVARLVKRAAAAAGLDPREFSGHSLRAGFATAAADAGLTDRQIMRTTGHGSEQMVRKYIRHAELFTDLPDLDL